MSIHRLKVGKDGKIADELIDTPGKHADGGGLYLQVAEPGQASWVYRFKWAGRERWKSLGPAALYSIEEARDTARDLARARKGGKDPLQVLAVAAKPAGDTFGEALAQYLADAAREWKGGAEGKQAVSYRNSFDRIPDFLRRPADGIEPRDITEAVKVWANKPVTHRRMKTRIKAILYFWKEGERRGRKGMPEVEHHGAMAADDVPAFIQELVALGTPESRALAFTILSAGRTEEIVGGTWGEVGKVDGEPTWVIPGDRMKAERTHRVPITPEMLALLGPRGADRDYLFADPDGERLADGCMLDLLNELRPGLMDKDGRKVVVHGFRSTFRDWVSERTDFRRELGEWSIAHAVGNKTEQDYARADLLAKRRPLMETWSKFATSSSP